MSNKLLTNELTKRIFANIGIVKDQIGIIGITTNSFLIKEKLKFKEENNSYSSYNIWAAQNVIDGSDIKIIFSNISVNNNIDYILIINSDDTFICLKYSNEDGNFLILHNNIWVEINMIHKLNLTIAFEFIAQNGLVWQPCTEYKNLYMTLVSSLSYDED